jgi:hypothetical protein
MVRSAYNGFIISVQPVVTPIENTRRPVTKISVVDGGEAIVCLYSTAEFTTDRDAEAYGFQMGKSWIDER